LPFVPIPVVLAILLLKAVSPGGFANSEPLAEGYTDPKATKDHLSVDLEKKYRLAAAVSNSNGELANDMFRTETFLRRPLVVRLHYC
jgi:hypothetical protein